MLNDPKKSAIGAEKEIESLFHYTTAAGLKGILESQSLWATNSRQLNDTNELKQAKEFLFSIFRPLVAKTIEPIRAANPDMEKKATHLFGSYENSVDQETYNLIKALRYPIEECAYILSFCMHGKDDYASDNGLLSMWRAYGQNNAYAIEFDVDGFVWLFREELKSYEYTRPIVGKVIYDLGQEHLHKTFEKEFGLLSSLANKMLQAMRDNKDQPDEQVTNEEFDAFLDVLLRVKNRGFEEEDEFRFAVWFQDREALKQEGAPLKKRKVIHHHAVEGFETISRIHLFDELQSNLPIKRIIVGPHAKKEEHAHDLERWLEIEGYDIPVVISQIPFRGMI